MTTCKLTYWMKDAGTQEWAEFPCVVEGRHSTHSLADIRDSTGVGQHVSFGASASGSTRAEMERSEAKTTATQRRHEKAVEDLERYTKWVEQTEAKLASYRNLQAEAQKILAANPLQLDPAPYAKFDGTERTSNPDTYTTMRRFSPRRGYEQDEKVYFAAGDPKPFRKGTERLSYTEYVALPYKTHSEFIYDPRLTDLEA